MVRIRPFLSFTLRAPEESIPLAVPTIFSFPIEIATFWSARAS
ncbi:uncharacterized protein METZ01_LOCUS424114, partial [marine metagenome]